jgi:predicted DCC family thiol-disulfide oxidoreductase YuxK
MLHAVPKVVEFLLTCSATNSRPKRLYERVLHMKSLTVYFDAGCGFCQWTKRWLDRFDPEGILTFTDYRECAMAPYSQAEMAGAMHVAAPEGRWFSGYDTFLQVTKALPKLRWLAPILGLPWVRWIGRIIYRLVATNRYGISWLLFRVAAVPRPCGVTCELTELSAREGVKPV